MKKSYSLYQLGHIALWLCLCLRTTFIPAQNCDMPTVSGIETLCNGQTITLTAESGYTNYVWSTNTTGQSINVNTPGQYQVTVTCANGNTAFANVNVPGFTTGVQVAGNGTICAGQCVNLSVQLLNGTNGPYTIVFSLSTGGTQSFTVNPSGGGPFTFINVCPTQTTTYTIQSVTNSQSCIAFINPNLQSATITVVGGGGLSINGPNFLCTGTSATLVANPSTYQSYQWSNGISGPNTTITQAGTYTVTATIASGCTVTATKTVQASNITPPVITGGTTLCAGGSLMLTANGTGYSAYNWSNNATTASITVSQSGTYTVTVTNAQGCTGTATQVIVGATLPSVTFSVANPDVCAGGCTSVTATFTGTAPFTLTYTTPGNGPQTQTFAGNTGTFQVCVPAGAPAGSFQIAATKVVDAWCTCE